MDADRYDRQRRIEGWNQAALLGSRVLVAGAGALGNELIKNLALLGVGHLLVVDFDRIDRSNLSRTVLFGDEDVGRAKALTAVEAAARLNPDVHLCALHGDLYYDVGLGFYRHCDLVVGGLDNLAARSQVGIHCALAGVPFLDGGMWALGGEVRWFMPGDGPCFECMLLVVSSRAAITREADVNLDAGLPLSAQIALEDRVDGRFESMRSLVTRIGGLSAYPAMILETDSLVWLADTFAHEWAHHFLIQFPLGYNYNQSGEMTSLNETTASIIGREIGRRVILRYYPELAERLPPLPVPPECPPMSAGELVWPQAPPPGVFDYNREMRITRLRVDELLEEGRIVEAEQYMEERRQRFVEHGHNIRKLNQAYFAFHGSYATSPSTGNPIGGQLEWLRAQHPTLRAFVRDIASVSRYEELKGALQARAQACTP